ncbi:MAG: response regulator transcription factor [Desulfuromonadales bacterium]
MSDSEQKLKILIVEDDELLRTALQKILAHFGHDVRGAGDSSDMDSALADYGADVVLLDINLPGEDGLFITQRLRQTSSCGIIMLTGRGQLHDKLEGYRSGADFYLVKPIDPEELLAAVTSLGRRVVPPVAIWRFDTVRSVLISPRNISIQLTFQQAVIVEMLTSKTGEIVTRSELLDALGHPDDEYARQRLETQLSRLRARVRAADPESELPIRARQSSGYSFLAVVI